MTMVLCISFCDFPPVIFATKEILRSGFKSQWGNARHFFFFNAPSNNLVSSRDFDSQITFSHLKHRHP